ncbi:putative RNA-directed DNA polymerase [Tanacetum coccineum]
MLKKAHSKGHLITKQGIKANPSKVMAVTNLEPPRTLKDVHSLNGKLASLSRFLSKSAEKSFPFFKALKSCTDKKTIWWTVDTEKDFLKMKEFMEILPTLTAPMKGKVLVMYLAALIEYISDVLLAEREKRQVPIYFVSRVLPGAEPDYLELEKLILALVHVTRRLQRLMFSSDVTSHVRHSRFMDEFDKFAAKEGESLGSVYERLTTLVNIMDRNNVLPISVSLNTKFLNCLQPEWSKYVTMVRHNQTRETVSYDILYDSLVQFEPHVLASKAKKAAKNHDPLAFIAYSNSSSSQSHANSFYSPQTYYVTHPSSVVDYEDEYQRELQGDSQKDKLTTAMMLLAQEITQKFSTPTNNRLRISLNTRNQAVIQDGRVDIQTKNASYGGNSNKNAWRQSRNQAFNARNGNDDINQIIQRVPQTKSTLRKANV